MVSSAQHLGIRNLVGAILMALFVATPMAQSANVVTCPAAVRVAYSESELPPYIIGDGQAFAEPPGLFVEWTRSVLKKLGCAAVMQEVRMPYNRIVSNMADGLIDIRVTGGYRNDVIDAMQFPLRNGKPDTSLAVADGHTHLYVLKGSKTISWKGTALNIMSEHQKIGTVRGHFADRVMQARNWPVEPVASWSIAVKMLQLERVAAIAGTESVIDALVERPLLEVIEPEIQSDLFFAPVSRQFFAQHPAFVARFWFELCRESRPTFHHLPACALNAQ